MRKLSSWLKKVFTRRRQFKSYAMHKRHGRTEVFIHRRSRLLFHKKEKSEGVIKVKE